MSTINSFLQKHIWVSGLLTFRMQTKCKGTSERQRSHHRFWKLSKRLCSLLVQLHCDSFLRVQRKCAVVKAAFGRSLSSPACIVCLFQCWFASPRFWSSDLAVTASDDRGIGEIAPRTPEDAAFTGEPEKGNKASAVVRPEDCKTEHCSMQPIGVIHTEQLWL